MEQRVRTLLLSMLVGIYVNISCISERRTFAGEMLVLKEPVVEMNTRFAPSCFLPVSPGKAPCPRAHQGLCNELVCCLEEDDDSVKIAYDSIIYGFDAETQKSLNTFWISKKSVVPLKDLPEGIVEAIPYALHAQDSVITLLYPWKTFSMGTRFKRVPFYDTRNAYAIQRVDFETNTVILDFVSRRDACIEVKLGSQVARKRFVKIINTLVDRVAQHGLDQVIPYVWGGSSFIVLYTRDDFYQQDDVWHRKGKNAPYCGYDCSEFIMRMAHIAGIKFPWKTTFVMKQSLRSLSEEDQLEDGDLIWVPGHVMIVSNKDNNEVIEARGYSSGYGCVHRITLDQLFDGIVTYDDLLACHYAKKQIQFKDKEGNVQEKLQDITLLKLID